MLHDQIGLLELFPDLFADFLGLRRVRATIVIEANVEAAKIFRMGFPDVGDKLVFADSLFLGGNSNGRAVSIVRAKIAAVFAAQFLKSNPNVRLNILNEMSYMDIAVGIWESASDKNFSTAHNFS